MSPSDRTNRNAGPRRTSDVAPELRFCGFELDGPGTLRAAFDVVEPNGHGFRAIARALSSGTLTDLQASDCDLGGTTGRAEVDAEIQACVHEELARARAVAAVADLDRGARFAG